MGYRRNNILLEAIAKKLKQLREDRGLSQVDVYIDTDLNISRIESGKTSITLTSLFTLCQYYEITLEDFFKDAAEQYKTLLKEEYSLN